MADRSFVVSSLAAATVCLTLACAQVDHTGAGGSGGAPDVGADVIAVQNPDLGVPVDGAGDLPPACVNLQCQQVSCPAGKETTVSGTTYAPNGKLPLYNVMVYVPNAPLPAFTDGVTCDRCSGGAPVRAVASAISDEHGRFRLGNVPAGKNIPLVVQVGKWRRTVTLPEVVACQDNPLTDVNLSRLPRNRKEGDMPRIAVTTGACDMLGCLLPQVGVDYDEVGIAGQDRAVTFYKGGLEPKPPYNAPPGATDATTLWNDEAALSRYDLALLSCECSETGVNKGAPSYTAMTSYLAKGGRIFGSHYMYTWLRNATDAKLSGAVTLQTPPEGQSDGLGGNPMMINTGFPKGKALADWLQVVNPMGTYGEIGAPQVFDDFSAVMSPAAQVWTSSMAETAANPGPRIFSINAPVGVPPAQQCGRAVEMDLHLGPPPPIGLPAGFEMPLTKVCGTNLFMGEEVLAFLFFDLAACVQDDSRPVTPPVVIP